MANGEAFDELRKMAEEGTDIPVKSMLRLIMAGMADMHDKDVEWRSSTEARLKKIEGVAKHPSALWYVVNMPLKALAFFVVIALVMVVAFVPEARVWAIESLVKTFLGGL